ncbi:MAG: VOC family protein [Chloroflexota bacterium]
MESPKTPTVQLESVIHIGIIVKDLEKVTKTWSSLFGIGPWTFRDIEAMDDKLYPRRVKLAFATLGNVGFEVMQPIDDNLKQDWLSTHGEGMHHLCFTVDDQEGALADLAAQGVKPYMHPPGGFSLLESWPGGIIFEINQKRSQ